MSKIGLLDFSILIWSVYKLFKKNTTKYLYEKVIYIINHIFMKNEYILLIIIKLDFISYLKNNKIVKK